MADKQVFTITFEVTMDVIADSLQEATVAVKNMILGRIPTAILKRAEQKNNKEAPIPPVPKKEMGNNEYEDFRAKQKKMAEEYKDKNELMKGH